ncbi:MAG: HAD hydrolase-like protein [Pseudomonadota bacterium]
MQPQSQHDQRVVFFDLDGTLTDPKVGITRCIQYALERTGADVPDADSLEWCIGPPLQNSMAALVGADRADRAVQYYRERFSEVGWSENRLYPGILRALEQLKQSEIALYIATSKPEIYATRIADHFGLSSFFNTLYGAQLDGTNAEKTQLLGAALADVKPATTATMIGDRLHDVEGALANGMTAIGVSYGYGSRTELRDAGAHKIVDDPESIVALFR